MIVVSERVKCVILFEVMSILAAATAKGEFTNKFIYLLLDILCFLYCCLMFAYFKEIYNHLQIYDDIYEDQMHDCKYHFFLNILFTVNANSALYIILQFKHKVCSKRIGQYLKK